jgi:parvulin-like peptidyl-prolyl isomerase
VEDEQTAQEVLDKLEAGESFVDLAAEYSTDESNKNNGGDLGWFSRSRMVEPFAEAAFAGDVGEIVGPVETSFGFHVIEIMGHEERELTDQQYQQAVEQALQEWLNEARQEAEVDVIQDWPQLVPGPPGVLPASQQ